MEHGEVMLDGAPNFRDLGGYPTDDGWVVRRSRVYRSGHLADLTDDDVSRLEELGIRTVVDFRQKFEVELFGNDRLPRSARYVALPIRAGGMDAMIHAAIRRGQFKALPDLESASRDFVRVNTEALGELFHLLADDSHLPAIVHCIGGKDRTGVASALILGILGVSWEWVRADYLRTNDLLNVAFDERLNRLVRMNQAEGSPGPDQEDLEAARRFFMLEPAYIDAALEEMERLAGSLDDYVHRQLGVGQGTVDRLREILLEPSTEVRPARPHQVAGGDTGMPNFATGSEQ